MRLFLDTSVLLAAAGSADGASRFLFLNARAQGWRLLSSPYCVDEAVRNLCKLGPKATHYWRSSLCLRVEMVPIELVFDQVLVFPKAKDRPVLLSALGAQAEVLLTLDEHDFQRVIGARVYGLRVRSPGQFLMEQRAVGRI